MIKEKYCAVCIPCIRDQYKEVQDCAAYIHYSFIEEFVFYFPLPFVFITSFFTFFFPEIKNNFVNTKIFSVDRYTSFLFLT
jgi:hypothetical protein